MATGRKNQWFVSNYTAQTLVAGVLSYSIAGAWSSKLVGAN